MDALRDACKSTTDEKIIPNINRVLNIWLDRSIYDKEFVQELRNLLSSDVNNFETISKIVSNFSSTEVINQITSVNKAEQLSQTKLQSLVNCKVDFANSELLNKLKDKSYGEQFSKEFDEATKCLEGVILATENEISVRKELLSILEKTKIFYDVQLKEAKTVAETFNNCELSIKHVQNKLANYSNNVSSPTRSLSITSTITTSQLSNVLNLFNQSSSQTSVSTLDQRLTNLMSNSGQFGLSLHSDNHSFSPVNKNLPTTYNPSTFDPNMYCKPFYPSEVTESNSLVSKQFEPSENLEPADMDLGNSDDEDGSNPKVAKIQEINKNSFEEKLIKNNPLDQIPFIPNPEMGAMFPLIPPPPPPPIPPKFEEFLNDFDYTQNLSNMPNLDTSLPQGNLISNLADLNRPQSYQHQPTNSNHWRNQNENRSSRNQNYSNQNSNRHGSRWKNHNGWKRSSYGGGHH